jgi:hypothetical protein
MNLKSKNLINAKAIVLNTEYTGEIIDSKINDEGRMIVDNKEFDLDKVKPILMKEQPSGGLIRRMMSKPKIIPYYIMKHTSVLPLMIKTIESDTNLLIKCPKCGDVLSTIPAKSKTLECLNLNEYKTKLSPSMQKETVEMRFLRLLKTYSSAKEGREINKALIMRIMGALFVGVLAIYFLNMMGFLKF